MKATFNRWWHGGNERFDDVVTGILSQYDGSFVFGGYVRGQVDREKEVSDVDIAVKEADFTKAENYLQSMGCEEVYRDQIPGWLDPRGDFECQFLSIGQYTRFTCPKSVQVDLIDDKAFSKTLDTMPSDVHFLVFTANGLTSYDEERFSTEDLIRNTKAKVYNALLSGSTGCEKLEREGFTGITLDSKE